jgi:siroheme synthase
LPLTHRRASDALVFITAHRASEGSSRGHKEKSAENDGADWSKLAASGATLVIYMPGQDYKNMSEKLTASGVSPQTPCAIISRATTKYQRTHLTTVLDLHRAPQLAAPTLLVVGEVVRMADPARMVEQILQPVYATAGNVFPSTPFENVPFADSGLRVDEEFRA